MSDEENKVVNLDQQRQKVRAAENAEFQQISEREKAAYEYLVAFVKMMSEMNLSIEECVRSIVAASKKTPLANHPTLKTMLDYGMAEDEIRRLLKFLENEFLSGQSS